jgi:cell division initiation protein
MKIAPIDIAHKQFAKKMMGFDANEVIEFLRDVADQMEEIIRERNTLKEALRDKEVQLIEARSRDEALKNTITTATRMTEQIRADAEREAKLILNDAQQKAELVVKDSRESLRRIYQDIAEMKRARMQFEAGVRSLVQSHLSLLDQARNLMPEITQTRTQPLSFQESITRADDFDITNGLKMHTGASSRIE